MKFEQLQWEKVLLWFRPTSAWAYPEMTVYFKTIFGKVYVTEIKHFPEMSGSTLEFSVFDEAQP